MRDKLRSQVKKLKSSYNQSEQNKLFLIKILKEKENFSICLSDKLDHLEILRDENRNLLYKLEECRADCEELISHGIEFLDTTNEVEN